MTSRNWTNSEKGEEKRIAREAKELQESKEMKRRRIEERQRGSEIWRLREIDKFSCLLQDDFKFPKKGEGATER